MGDLSFQCRSLSPAEEAERQATGLTHAQYLVFSDPARFRVLVAGRRFGATFLAIREIVRALRDRRDVHVAYVAPTLKVARMAVWDALVGGAIPQTQIGYVNRTNLELRVKPQDGTVRLYGADNPRCMRGCGFDFVIIDGANGVREQAWTELLRPALAERGGRVLILTGVDASTGVGSWVHDVYHRGLDPAKPDWSSYAFSPCAGVPSHG